MSLYFIAIEPTSDLIKKIKELQRDFAERFQSKKAFQNFPHITIIPPFMHDEKNESEVLGQFLKTEIQTQPFEIILKDFACFRNKKSPVIFIKPSNADSLNQLYEEINVSMESFNYVRNFNPHLTVAYRDLTSENFEKAWEEYEDKDFKERFDVQKVGLYKHFNQRWNLISTKELKKS